ncbi:unnamed protein product, partial [Symbiodinium pilosum]
MLRRRQADKPVARRFRPQWCLPRRAPSPAVPWISRADTQTCPSMRPLWSR